MAEFTIVIGRKYFRFTLRKTFNDLLFKLNSYPLFFNKRNIETKNFGKFVKTEK